jgi:hypothetical protein
MRLTYADYEDGTIYARHNYGLFSNVSTVLWSVAEAMRRGFPVLRVDNSRGMHHWKNEEGSDTWHTLYEQPWRGDVEVLMRHAGPKQWHFSCHGDYHGTVQSVGAVWLHMLLNTYLRPSALVRRRARYFEEAYGIGRNTVVVCYRGTDKHVEEPPVPLAKYTGVVDRLMQLHAEPLRVLIQTDQAQVRSAIKRRYGDACAYIEELPATRGGTVLHRLPTIHDREQFAVDLVAMVTACQKARFVITHTGNVGFFLAVPRILAGLSVVQMRAAL